MFDTSGQRITKRQRTRSMNYSLLGGGFGAVWFLLCSPQQLLTVFIKNHLGASAAQLGFFIAAFNVVSLAHLSSILFYSRLKSIKPFWLTVGILHRSLSMLIAASAFYVAFGGSRETALYLVMGTVLAVFFIGSTASSGWWSWMHELVPTNAIGKYFGRRSATAQTMNICFFFAATIFLDLFSNRVFLVYGFVYLTSSFLGLIETIMHIPIPEPSSAHKEADRTPLKFSTFTAPLQSKTFISFCLISAMAILAINVANPFFPAYITDPERLGVPNIWLGIMFAVSQLFWVLLVPFWGTLMDRFGRKAITLVGMLCASSFTGYLVLTPGNYPFLLPLIAAVWGFFAPALYEGLNQIMFSLLPQKNRTIYIAWFWALLGLISAGGPIIGGLLLNATGNIMFVVLTSIALLFCVFLLMDNLHISKERRFSLVFPTLTTPTIVKAYYNMPYIAKPESPNKVKRALRRMEGSSSSLAFDEILLRLDDPDEEIREEAVKALGRIGGEKAEEVLISQLSNEDPSMRVACIRALGKIGSSKAAPFLIDGLASSDEQVSSACARALGSIDDLQGAEALISLIRGNSPLKVRITGAEAISRKGYVNALQDILNIREHTNSPVMKKQLALSIANLLGIPGEFYTYITGTEDHRQTEAERLLRKARLSMRMLGRTDRGGVIEHILKDLFPQVIAQFESGNYNECFDLLYQIVSNLLYWFIELEGEDIRSVSIVQLGNLLVKKEPHLFAGFTLFQWYEIHYKPDHAFEEIDILLCLYFLAYYSKGWDSNPSLRPKRISAYDR